MQCTRTKKKTKIDLHTLLNYKTKGIKPAFNRLQKATSKPKYVQAKLVLPEKMVRSFLSNKWSFSYFSNYEVQDIPTEFYQLMINDGIHLLNFELIVKDRAQRTRIHGITHPLYSMYL